MGVVSISLKSKIVSGFENVLENNLKLYSIFFMGMGFHAAIWDVGY